MEEKESNSISNWDQYQEYKIHFLIILICQKTRHHQIQEEEEEEKMALFGMAWLLKMRSDMRYRVRYEEKEKNNPNSSLQFLIILLKVKE